MEVGALLTSCYPSWGSVGVLFTYLGYLALAGGILPGKVIPGALLPDGNRVYYRCNGLAVLLLLIGLLWIGNVMKIFSPTVIADKGAELLLVTFIFSVMVTHILYITGCKCRDQSSSLKAHVTGNFLHDWWFGVQLNPHVMNIDLKFFFIRAGMMGWLLINLSICAKSFEDGNANLSVILYQIFCALYIIDYFLS
ncbi:hypothetical protein HPP92_002062 [Vanilla planifolia]|uniref:Uncharacterized protein n=1 Tax=Vanilla planifolia TaxID=51239 RepID=A0A835RZG6_VANPL|nr:hypothetical protein HPP92_002062 [Vanilla planifolia]